MLQLLWHLSLTLSYVPLAYFICRLLVYGLKNQSAEHNITFKTVSSHLCLAARSSLNQGWLRTSCIVGRSAHRNLRQKTDSALQWLVTALLPCKEIKMSGSVLHEGIVKYIKYLYNELLQNLSGNRHGVLGALLVLITLQCNSLTVFTCKSDNDFGSFVKFEWSQLTCMVR